MNATRSLPEVKKAATGLLKKYLRASDAQRTPSLGKAPAPLW